MPFFKLQEFCSGESIKCIFQISSTERWRAVPKQVNFKYCVYINKAQRTEIKGFDLHCECFSDLCSGRICSLT